MHVIETTASIPNKFFIVIKTTKCSSWVVQTRHIGKMEKSAYLPESLTDRQEIWHDNAL